MVLAIYGDVFRAYNVGVAPKLTVGDVIRKARAEKGWNQERLGSEAASYVIRRTTPIDKNTVSKVERDPYSSELETVWRLLAALGLTLADVEREVGLFGKLQTRASDQLATVQSVWSRVSENTRSLIVAQAVDDAAAHPPAEDSARSGTATTAMPETASQTLHQSLGHRRRQAGRSR